MSSMRPCSHAHAVVLAVAEKLPRHREAPEMRIHQMIAAALAVAFATAGAAAAATLQPGTYNAVTPGTTQPAAKGNELVVVRAAAGRLSFGLNAIRLLDNNTGYIHGAFDAGSNAVWLESGNGVRCRLRFVAAGATLIRVTQDARFGDCGFGYGVLADGLYVRTRSTGKIAPWNGP
jgi:hypothetical protein